MAKGDDPFDFLKRMEDLLGVTARRQLDEFTGKGIQRKMDDLTGATARRQMEELTGEAALKCGDRRL